MMEATRFSDSIRASALSPQIWDFVTAYGLFQGGVGDILKRRPESIGINCNRLCLIDTKKQKHLFMKRLFTLNRLKNVFKYPDRFLDRYK